MSFTIRHRSALAGAAATLASLGGAAGAFAQATPPAPPPVVQAGPLGASATVGVGGLAVQTDPQLASLQGLWGAGQGQLAAALDNARSTTQARVRSLGSRVRGLRRRARRAAARGRDHAISQAQGSANGAWLVVSGSGAVVDQSGGMTVSQVGTGTYAVSFGSGTATCIAQSGSMQVQLSGPTGPVDGGFFLA